MNDLILSDEQDGVLTVTLNRLDKRNAINSLMYSTLSEIFRYAAKEPSVRCLVIQGSNQCFSAGNDYHDFVQSIGAEELAAFEFIRELAKFDKPLIAAVAGPAVGIGTTMLLHCDMVFCSDNAKFILPFTKLGICLEAGASVLLPAKVGSNRAFELAVLGGAFNAEQALNYGIVNAICDADDLLGHANQKARAIAALPVEAALTAKRLMKDTLKAQVDNAIEKEFSELHRLLATDDCQNIMAKLAK